MQRIGSAVERKDHVFVDGVRFWAMASVIALHSLHVFIVVKRPEVQLAYLLATPVKFGTIGFFLISGFLLGDRLETCRPMSYLGRRMQTVFIPWLCWFTLMLAYRIGNHRVELASGAAGRSLIGAQIFQVFFFTSFWFVPNLLVGLSVLLLFRRRIFDLRLGAAFLAIDLFYTVNIYGRWIPSGHTEALLGFVFFLWLGSYASGRMKELSAWLARIPMYWMVGLTIAAGCSAYGEARWLAHLGCADPINTLRLTNQVFSILVVLTLMKVRRATWPSLVNARRVTFGLYLSHPLALDAGMRVARWATHGFAGGLLSSYAGLTCLWLTVFAVVYAVGLTVTQLLVEWPTTRWLVGAASERKPVMTAEAPGKGVAAWTAVVAGSNG